MMQGRRSQPSARLRVQAAGAQGISIGRCLMRQLKLPMSLVVGAILSFGLCAAADQSPQTSSASEPAVWQHHQELINYYGVTETYTCTGIEDKVRQVLL